MPLLFNDGNGAKDRVTFIAVDFVHDIKKKYKVKNLDGSVAMVYPEMLNYINSPDVASILQTSEQYCHKCKKSSCLK